MRWSSDRLRSKKVWGQHKHCGEVRIVIDTRLDLEQSTQLMNRRETYFGNENEYVRSIWMDLDANAQKETMVQAIQMNNPGAKLMDMKLENIERLDAGCVVDCTYSAPLENPPDDDMLLYVLPWTLQFDHSSFGDVSQRKMPFYSYLVGYSGVVKEHVKLTLPDGWSPLKKLKKAKLTGPDCKFKIDYTVKDNILNAKYELHLPVRKLETNEVILFKEFLEQLHRKMYKVLVFEKE